MKTIEKEPKNPTSMSNEDSVKRLVKSPRYRANQCWTNTETLEEYYGIQAQKKKNQRWMMVHNKGVALIYKTKAQAEKIARWLNDPTGTEPEWNTDLVT